MPSAFNEIPDNIRVPFVYVEFDPSQADRGLSTQQFTVLLAGQMLPSGKAEPLTPHAPATKEKAWELFGQGSQLAQMAEAYLKANRFTKMTAIGVLDAPEGAAATGTLTVAGTVSRAAPICLYVGGALVRSATFVGQGAAEAAANLAAAINASASLAVTAAVGADAAANVITLTAKHKGECGNDIDLRLSYLDEDMPAGLAIAIERMSGGAGNPAPGPTLAMVDALDSFNLVAWPWLDAASLNALRDALDDRAGPLRQQDGHAMVVKTGVYADVVAFSAARNDWHLTVFASEGSPTLPWADCAASAAIVGYYAAIHPARPFQTLTIPGVLAPAVKDRWPLFPEKNQALYEGCSARAVTEGGEVQFLNVITTYRKTENGADTQAYLQLNYVLELFWLRKDLRNYIMLKYPRYLLANDDEGLELTPGLQVMTPSLMKTEIIAKFDEWRRAGLVEAPADFAARLTVERDQGNPSRLNVFMSPDLMNQFRICATQISFLL
jgi:phage tail sheath gpL-like